MPKSKKTLTVRVGTLEEMTGRFVKAWKRAEAGLPQREPTYVLQFTDTATLFKYLSPRRFELLQHLRESGPLSIRRLASQLKRDYKNVHTDVKELIAIGLIEENDENLLLVPWDSIVTELPLLAKAK